MRLDAKMSKLYRKTIFIFIIILLIIIPFSKVHVFSSFSSSSKVLYLSTYPEDAIEKKCKKCTKEPIDLVFYFHGAGGRVDDFAKPYSFGGLNLEKENKFREDIVFLSFCYDTNFHWASSDIVKDSIAEIHRTVNKFNVRKIILIGISSGGTLALNILSLADKKLQEKITNVLAVFPITDYKYTEQNNKSEWLQEELKKHFAQYKNPEIEEKNSSPITWVSKIPSSVEIALVEGTNDTLVNPAQIEKYYNELKKTNNNSVLIKLETNHLVSPYEKDFSEILNLILR